MDICLVRINKKNRLQIQYSGANRPLVFISKGNITEIKPDKQPIGYYEHAQPFSVQEIELTKDTCLYLFSDGYADQFGGEKNKKLGTRKWKEMLAEISGKDMKEQGEFLKEYFEKWKSAHPQTDDVTVLGIRI
jgi:serine phosphatase RsbU (regulator of sigma subunit)